jgi:hypothetical protein
VSDGPGAFGTNTGDIGRVRVLDVVCPSCRSLIGRMQDLGEPSLWIEVRKQLKADGLIVMDHSSDPAKLKTISGHRQNCTGTHG